MEEKIMKKNILLSIMLLTVCGSSIFAADDDNGSWTERLSNLSNSAKEKVSNAGRFVKGHVSNAGSSAYNTCWKDRSTTQRFGLGGASILGASYAAYKLATSKQVNPQERSIELIIEMKNDNGIANEHVNVFHHVNKKIHKGENLTKPEMDAFSEVYELYQEFNSVQEFMYCLHAMGFGSELSQ
jgi:hypothetical protein